MKLFVDTPLHGMKAGDTILLDGYKTPFTVTKIRDDHLVCQNNRSGTFCVHSKKYQRVVRTMSEWMRV